MTGKIIGVGFHKTGTSTLRKALEILGYRVKDVTPRALIPILKGDYKRVLNIIEGYDAVEDTPWFMIYKELDKRLPGSKFILTIRDEESWYKSVSAHIGNLRAAHHEWIYGKGKGLPKDDKENAIKVYNDHIEDVMDYFRMRPGDLLVLNFTRGDEWDKLCRFLGKEVPGVPFPHANKAEQNPALDPDLRMKLKLFRKRIKNTLKITYIQWKGLY